MADIGRSAPLATFARPAARRPSRRQPFLSRSAPAGRNVPPPPHDYAECHRAIRHGNEIKRRGRQDGVLAMLAMDAAAFHLFT